MTASLIPPKPDPQALWVSLQVTPLPHPGQCPPLNENVGPLPTACRTLVLWPEIEASSLVLEGIVLATGLLRKSRVNGPCVEFPPRVLKRSLVSDQRGQQAEQREQDGPREAWLPLGQRPLPALHPPGGGESTAERPPGPAVPHDACRLHHLHSAPRPAVTNPQPQHHPGDPSLLQTLLYYGASQVALAVKN